MAKKLTKADLKRIEDLSKKMVEDKKSLEKDKQKLKKMQKEVDAEKKKLAGQWKELKNAKKQAQQTKEFKAGVAAKDAKKATKGGGGGNIKKLQAELLEMKTKFNHEGKRARQFKQQVDQLTAENKVLQKKLKNLQGRKEKGEDPRIKNLLRENKQLKKQIKMLMIELNKKRRWFQRCIKSFKSSRQKWIKQQEDTFKKKGFLIKYVFLDDVKQIKQYKDPSSDKKGGKGKKLKFRNKIKVKSRDGGTFILKDVEIVVLDNDDDDDDNGGKGKGKKGKKSGKKSKGEEMEEMEAMIAEFEKELQVDQDAIGGGGDDYKDSDAEFDMDDDDDLGDLDGDYTMDQLQVDANADNVDGDGGGGDNDGGKGDNNNKKSGGKSPKPSGGKSPKSPGTASNGGRKSGKKGGASGGATDYLGLPVQNSIDAGDNAALQAQLVYLKKELDDRTDDIEKLKEIVSDGEKYPDPKGEVKNYILQINKRGDELIDKMDNELHADKADIDQMKANNDRWSLWLNNLSAAMAKNGALFNQLCGVYEYYLKELKGRVYDLTTVNNTFYNDKGNEEEKKKEEDDGDNEDAEKKEDEEEEFGKLKKVVVDRHNDVEGQFKNMEEKQEKDDEEEEKNADDNYGAEDKEKQALDANTDKVKEIRDNLVNNNSDWRQLIDTVSSDYDAATSEKNKLVNGLNGTSDELKDLLDLISKIPQRKILDDNNNNNDDDENEEDAEEPAAGGNDEDND